MKIKLLTVLALCTVLSFSGCKEEPSQIPTVPTTLSLEDGAVVEELNVELSASGSTVEDNGFNVSYVYYIGKSEDALEKTKSEVELEPYTQYFWCAQAKTEAGEGEKTEVRTFYCVPPFSVATDNGDGMYAAVIKWDNGDKFKSVTVSATANHDGYELEPQTITDGADSCYFVRKRDASDPTKDNAFVQWWDDEHGVYAEPVVYDFTVEATAQVGDKAFTLKGNAKECILDKQHVVRDHEFNVYRVVTHGNQTWLADDLRVTSYINEKGEVVKLQEGKEFVYSTLKSGAKGVLYNIREVIYPIYTNYNNTHVNPRGFWEWLETMQFGPQGYVLPSDDDFLQLEKEYGIPEISIEDRIKRYYTTFSIYYSCYYYERTFNKDPGVFEGEDTGIMLFLSSPYDWENVAEIPGQGWFNAKPFGLGEPETIGKVVAYFTTTTTIDGSFRCVIARALSNLHKGIARVAPQQEGLGYTCFRCIKKQ
jgi:uncharacterized protein (TIGR02145 family)